MELSFYAGNYFLPKGKSISSVFKRGGHTNELRSCCGRVFRPFSLLYKMIIFDKIFRIHRGHYKYALTLRYFWIFEDGDNANKIEVTKWTMVDYFV